jgi:hypothetical protein
VEKEEEVTLARFVAVDRRRGAGERLAGGAQAAWPRNALSGSAPAWERGRWCWASCGEPVELLDCSRTGRHELEKGERSGVGARMDAGVQRRARAGRRCVAFIGECGRCCSVGRLPRSVHAALAGAPGRRSGRRTAGSSARAVRRGTTR